jgi:hypothetical protein
MRYCVCECSVNITYFTTIYKHNFLLFHNLCTFEVFSSTKNKQQLFHHISNVVYFYRFLLFPTVPPVLLLLFDDVVDLTLVLFDMLLPYDVAAAAAAAADFN